MKFKALISLLLTLSLVLLLISCNETPPTQTTTGETTTEETTTAETTKATTESSSLLTETYVFPPAPSTGVHHWNVPINKEWLFTPEYEKESSEKYDFEFTITNASQDGKLANFWSMPNDITCHIVNKTGEHFWQVGTAYLEYKSVTVSGVEGWIRVPYANITENKQGLLEYPSGEGTYTLELNNQEHLGENLSSWATYESGDYRIVFFLNDGPHYAYFFVTAVPA